MYVCICICIVPLFKNVTKYKLNNKTFQILLYFNFLQIFYELTMKPKV